jgi:hypothetical protein
MSYLLDQTPGKTMERTSQPISLSISISEQVTGKDAVPTILTSGPLHPMSMIKQLTSPLSQTATIPNYYLYGNKGLVIFGSYMSCLRIFAEGGPLSN